MQTALHEAIFLECEALTDWLWTQVQSKAPPEVRRDMMGKEVLKVGGQVIGRVLAGGMMALVTEWGSGSLADESNPAWDEYVESKYYNPARYPYGHPITGRPAGEYINLDDETKVSTGKAEGLNLEQWLPPEEPQHWMREIVSLSRVTILERLLACVQAFPMHKFIYSDGR